MEAPVNYPKSSELERELVSRLRESASGNARAMAATVVVAGRASDAASGDALVDKLMGRRPARIIHLRTQVPDVPDGFRAWSSARCSLDRQNRGVCFEDIYIESANEAAADARSWSPFVMRELPALLLWRFPVAALTDTEGDCAERVDLVVVDGGADPFFPREGAVGYARMAFGAQETISAFADLAWERGEGLRTATARLFDAPGNPAVLSSLTGVEVSGPDPWSAALHAAWLASRLGFSGDRSSVDGSGPWTSASGASMRVDIGAARFPSCVLRFSDGGAASASFSGPGECVLRFVDGGGLEMLFPAPDDGAVLARLIDAPLADPLYAKALSALAGPRA